MFSSHKQLLLDAEAQLDHDRLIAIINSLTDGFLAVDEQGVIKLSNSTALDLLDANTLQNKNIYHVLRLVDKVGKNIDLLKIAQDLKSTRSYTTRDFRLMLSDGSLINLHFNISAVRSGYGSKSSGGFVIIFRDITREKNLEAERDEFISVVSHELRNPVTIAEGGVSNAVLLAEQSHLPESIMHSLKSAHQQLMFLESLINDLAMLSRADRGKLGLSIEAVDLPGLIESLVHDYKSFAANKSLELKSNLDPDASKIDSSQLYVHEILQNFISNSIKYTEKGTITIISEALPGSVSITVSDTGIGVDQSEQPKLFNKFFRSQDFRVRQISGTGLGLYVSAKLAHLLGGNISMKSEMNRGSSFTLTLPSSAYRELPKKPA